ncbi:chemotaxis protein CheC [Oscillospiraceae bacterium LTW-04]
MDIAAKDSCSGLSPMEIDAIGEVLNISMGSAATAVSTMLDKQVTITTPRVSVEPLGLVEYSALEPALSVKITYTEGLSGSNVLIFRQRDMQLILNQLMGIDDPPSDDFALDELSMSAACEVMNQMMGASATALAEFLGKAVNISTPEARIITPDYTFSDAIGMDANQQIVSIHFNMDIQGVMTSEFVSAMPCDLAKSMVSGFLETTEPEESAAPPAPAPSPPEVAQSQPAAPLPVSSEPTTTPQPQGSAAPLLHSLSRSKHHRCRGCRARAIRPLLTIRLIRPQGRRAYTHPIRLLVYRVIHLTIHTHLIRPIHSNLTPRCQSTNRKRSTPNHRPRCKMFSCHSFLRET